MGKPGRPVAEMIGPVTPSPEVAAHWPQLAAAEVAAVDDAAPGRPEGMVQVPVVVVLLYPVNEDVVVDVDEVVETVETVGEVTLEDVVVLLEVELEVVAAALPKA